MRLDRLSRSLVVAQMLVMFGMGDERFAVDREGGENGRSVVPSQVATGELDDEVGVFGNALLLDEISEGDLVVAEKPFGSGLHHGRKERGSASSERAACQDPWRWKCYPVKVLQAFAAAQAELKDKDSSS